MKTPSGLFVRIASIASLCLFTVAASAQTPPTGSAKPLPWAQTLGQPDVMAGKQVGFFIWHDANYVYLVTTDETDHTQAFTGTIRVAAGKIANVSGIALEKDDSFKQVSPSELQFHFNTAEHTDGIRFQISDDAGLIGFNLQLQGKPSDQVFLGKNEIEPEESSFNNGWLIFRVPDDVRPLPWSQTLGQPKILAGKQVGFFIWHDANYVYLATTDETDDPQRFAGAIVVSGGTIANVSGIALEKDDSFKQVSPNELRFDFHTAEHIDALKFQISNGSKYLAFYLKQQNHPANHIFLGAKMTEAPGDEDEGVVVFDLSK